LFQYIGSRTAWYGAERTRLWTCTFAVDKLWILTNTAQIRTRIYGGIVSKMKYLVAAAVVLLSLSLNAQDANKNPNKSEPPILGPHWAHGVARAHAATGNPDMTYHGGPILPSVTVKAIFGVAVGQAIPAMKSLV
jgi:hypothetical protein